MSAPAEQRFFERVREHGECWLWVGATDSKGYGSFRSEGRRSVRAHRWAFEYLVCPIPTGLVLDHLCRVRNCVNPDHLEPVTHRINILRGVGPTAVNAEKTECPKGHQFSPALRARAGDDSPRRVCLACDRERVAAARARRRLGSPPSAAH